MRGQRLLLRSVKLEESLVTDYMDAAMEIFKANTAGPQKYLNTYKKYSDLLNNKAEQEVTAFLKDSHSIEGFKQVNYLNYPSSLKLSLNQWTFHSLSALV